MRRLMILAGMLLVVAAWSPGAPARAAFDPFEWQPAASDPRSFTSVRERYADLLAVYDYPAVFRLLQRAAATSPAWTGNEPVHANLLAALEILNERFATFSRYRAAAGDGAPDLDRLLEEVPTGLFQCVDETCFAGWPFQVTYDQLAELPADQGADFLYRVDAVDRLLWKLKEPALRDSVRSIQRARRRWDRFVAEGMSQFPWEAGFNGFLGPEGTIEVPPARQWIVLHPQLGVEVSTDGIKDLRASESLLVDLFGHVWYRWGAGADPELRWWGVSAAASLRDDLRPGIGLLGRYGRLITLGILWHDEDQDDAWFDEAPFLTFGIDLFRLVEARAPAYRAEWRRAQEMRERLLGEE